jgi:hypothetical protein
VITGADLVGLGEWEITVSGTPWQSGGQAWESSIAGTEVDLHAAEDTSTLYRILSHTESSLTISTADDLSGVYGQELIGVHRFDRLEVRNGASLSVGDDRLLVSDTSAFVVDEISTIQAGDLYFAYGLALDNQRCLWALPVRSGSTVM